MVKNFSEEHKSGANKYKNICAERILREWCSVVQLYIHHDNLKQTRINHFLSIQAALLAFVGLSTKFAFEGRTSFRVFITFLLFSICISIIGGLLAKTWRTMDVRARKFTLFHRKRIRELENEWHSLFPEDKEGLSTYTHLAVILEKPNSKDFLNILPEDYETIENNYVHDYKILKEKTPTASSREYYVLTVIFWFWIFSIVGHICLIFTLIL